MTANMLFKCLLKVLQQIIFHSVTTDSFSFPDPADYNGGTFSLSFTSLTSGPVCASVVIVDDNICEGDETFNIQLNTSDSDILLNPDAGTATIVDDDGTRLYNAVNTMYYRT